MPPPLLAPPPYAPGGFESDDEWGCATHPAPRAHPRELNTRNCGPFLAVAPDKLSARYDGNGAHGNDVGAAQADAPVPDDVAVFYFEVRVASAGARGCIGIGFTDNDFKTSRQPGWEANSYGYHGDDGRKFAASPRGDAYGPTFTTGDVVGAGIVLSRGEIFFTKNGKSLGVAFRGVRLPLFATVGLHSSLEEVEVNFGSRPFVFDARALAAEEAAAARAAAGGAVPLPRAAPHALVRQYLAHYGYAATLAALDAAAPPPQAAPSAGDVTLRHRAAARAAMQAGDVDAAEAALRAAFPALLPAAGGAARGAAGDAVWALGAARYLEALRCGEAERAVALARAALAPLRGSDATRDAAMARLGALLAYDTAAAAANGAAEPPGGDGDAMQTQPQAPPPALAALLTQRQREASADALNFAMLRAAAEAAGVAGDEPRAGLETALRQLAACEAARREAAGGQGERFSLHAALLGGAVPHAPRGEQPAGEDTAMAD